MNNQMLMMMFQNMMGQNPQMQQMFRMAQQMASNNPKLAAQNIMNQKGLKIEEVSEQFINMGKQLGFNEAELRQQLSQLTNQK